MSNTGRKIFQFLKQVNKITGIETGVKKANLPQDPDYVAPAIDYNKCPIVGWQAVDPSCITTPTCQLGYSLSIDSSVCERVEEIAAIPPGEGGTAGVAVKVNNIEWNNGGGRIYDVGYSLDGNGPILASLLTPHFWVNGDSVWDINSRNLIDGRMNACGIWSNEAVPDYEYIGFSRKITTPIVKTYYVGIAADNGFRIIVNGIKLIEATTINGGPNFNYWNIYPIELKAGDNFIEVLAVNQGGDFGFGAEIYDMTALQLQNATQESDLNTIFSTKDIINQPFDIGETQGWSCPQGWFLDTSNNTFVCRRIDTQTPTLIKTGFKKFSNRARLTNGSLDGYIEPNLEGSGIGPFFPPVQDHINCPPN